MLRVHVELWEIILQKDFLELSYVLFCVEKVYSVFYFEKGSCIIYFLCVVYFILYYIEG